MVAKSRSAAASTFLLLTLVTFAVFLGAGEASGAQLTASWVDNSSGTATTRLERRLGTDVAFSAVADVPPGVTAYVDASVSSGTTYCYRALAYDAIGVSPYSDEVCTTTSSTQGYQLTVSKAGTGTGTVASAPAGILCGTTCSATYVAGTAVTLTATPDIGSTFTGWSGGGCAGTAPCTLAANAPVTVTATFTAATQVQVTVSNAGTGTGTVASAPAGILCGTTCSATYVAGTAVTLTATPDIGSTFTGWSGGGCAGTAPCTLAGDASVTVTASFSLVSLPSYSLTVVSTGPGRVTSTPSGINCGSVCSATYPSGTLITLTATPNSASAAFTGWSGGACSGSAPTCTITMTGVNAVSATFKGKGGLNNPKSNFASATGTFEQPLASPSAPVGDTLRPEAGSSDPSDPAGVIDWLFTTYSASKR